MYLRKTFKEKILFIYGKDYLKKILLNNSTIDKNGLDMIERIEDEVFDFMIETSSGKISAKEMIAKLLIEIFKIDYYKYQNLQSYNSSGSIIACKIFSLYRCLIRMVAEAFTIRQIRLIKKIKYKVRNDFILNESNVNVYACIIMFYFNIMEDLEIEFKNNNSVESFYKVLYDEKNLSAYLSILSSLLKIDKDDVIDRFNNMVNISNDELIQKIGILNREEMILTNNKLLDLIVLNLRLSLNDFSTI